MTSIPILWSAWALMLKRLHDFGRGWGWLVPVVALGVMTGFVYVSGDVETYDTCLGANIILGCLVGLFKGSAGSNRFGPDPLEAERHVPVASMK